ncbi:glycoside hydrolase N-terminal domain-containing protein [Streptomyces sp. NPDC001880]
MTSGITRRTTVKTAIGATGPLALGIPALSGAAAAVGTSDQSGSAADAKKRAEPTLRYDAPAVDWERESLPMGGGALGASVYGTLASEQLTFNEKTPSRCTSTTGSAAPPTTCAPPPTRR